MHDSYQQPAQDATFLVKQPIEKVELRIPQIAIDCGDSQLVASGHVSRATIFAAEAADIRTFELQTAQHKICRSFKKMMYRLMPRLIMRSDSQPPCI